MHRQQWTPDTCPHPGCKIECDTTLPGNLETWPVTQVIRRCSEHAGIADPDTLRTTLLAENRNKNYSRQEILDGLAELGITLDMADPAVRAQFDQLVEYVYDVGTRQLRWRGRGRRLSVAEQNKFQQRCDARFGAGVVVIDR